jgi:pyrimidine-nucleoside phosphorylase
VIDPGVGFVISVKPGDRVERGQPIATVHAKHDTDLRVGLATLRSAISFGEPTGVIPVISHRITAEGVEAWPGSPS